ncbi:MAG: hypothetical protein KDB61_03535 [Planctomycetes bacterium]|nr:hypothetical protein [Planctomycetota bacterium]
MVVAMASSPNQSPFSRLVLAPATLAVLIAGPLASFIAGQFGVSWWMAFLLSAGVLTVFWDVAILRDGKEMKPLAEKQDPVFGSMHSFVKGLWELDEPVQLEGAWLPVAVAAGDEGPSNEQREAYREFLRYPAHYREQLVEAIIRQADGSGSEGLQPLRMFLPETTTKDVTNLEIEVQVAESPRGPHAEVISFRDGQAIGARAA